MKEEFTQSGLNQQGFSGWLSFKQIALQANLPVSGGIYVVYLANAGVPEFLEQNSAGRFKGRCPTVTVNVLRANWVDGAEVLYVGQSSCLRRRILEFTKFGLGVPIGHWGGRLIWQIVQSAEFLVAWKETPHSDPKTAEKNFISQFRTVYGKPPFANNPHLCGR